MTERTTRSLTLASDPVARLREIHDLDNPAAASPTAPAIPPNGSGAAAKQRSNVETVEPESAAAVPPRQQDANERDNVAAPKRATATAYKRSGDATGTRRNEDLHNTDNPVHEAMRQMLRAPYSGDLNKGPATATTIRVPTEIWERLDMASTLESQTKQDIIAEALKQYLKKIGRGEV